MDEERTEGMISVNERMKDLRYQYGVEHIKQEDLAEALNIPKTSLSDYEQEGANVPLYVIIRYCKHFGVTADYMLGLTEIKDKPHVELHELHLSEPAMEKLKNQTVNPWLLSDVIEHEQFDGLMVDASIYVEGYLDKGIRIFNALIDTGRRVVSENVESTPERNKDLKQMEYTHMSQDSFFAHAMHDRFKTMLHDIRQKRHGDADSSDMPTEKQLKLLEKMVESASKRKSKDKKGFTAIIKGFFGLFQIKDTGSNIKAAEELIEGGVTDDKTLENLVGQSELIEGDRRKRARAAKAIRDAQETDSGEEN